MSIGFRLNYLLSNGKRSRFGFEAEAKETRKAIQLARNSKNIKIVGLHFHLGGSRTIEHWKDRAEQIVYWADELLKEEDGKILI